MKGNFQIPNQGKYAPKRAFQNLLPTSNTLLGIMEEGREYQSLFKYRIENINTNEIEKALGEISKCTGRYTIAYLANTISKKIKEDISINEADDTVFAELIRNIPTDVKDIDIVLHTPGGSGEQVDKFVSVLRPRFETVRFIIPSTAMSAGTIFAMSGDEIIMTENSFLGPTDPQTFTRNGMYVPAQSLLALVEHIREKGQEAINKGVKPDWLDLQMLSKINPMELGYALNSSKYSVELVTKYLSQYKFKSWITHTSTGAAVTEAEKLSVAKVTAEKFCEHAFWKTHARGIKREIATSECKIRIIKSEDTLGLDKAIRRSWAATFWFFENSAIFKMFVSPHYSLYKQDVTLAHELSKLAI